MGRAIDLFVTYRFIKLLVTPFEKTEAFKLGIIDADGNLANNPFLVYGQPRRSLKTFPRISDSTGFVKVSVQPFKSGDLKLRTRSIAVKRIDRIYGSLKVQVPEPKLKKIVFDKLFK